MTAKRSESLKFMSVSAYAAALPPLSLQRGAWVGARACCCRIRNAVWPASMASVYSSPSFPRSLLPCPMPDELALHPSDLVVRYITFSDFPIRLVTFGPFQLQATTFTVFAASRI